MAIKRMITINLDLSTILTLLRSTGKTRKQKDFVKFYYVKNSLTVSLLYLFYILFIYSII